MSSTAVVWCKRYFPSCPPVVGTKDFGVTRPPNCRNRGLNSSRAASRRRILKTAQ
ncbi:unnamed protein product [Timema podura]|uniref:Uncharacterized protein n=1 Tax=Timema podura TaxID=61482 RepID=A0ABN7PEK6_TIMPD|nr:unnamed protein product [Timema podura]